MSDDRKTKAELIDELGKLRRQVARLEKSQAAPKKPTEQKRVKNELRIKDQAVACSINAIALSDLDGNLTYVNRSFLDMWGYEHEQEVLGKPAVYFMKAREKASEVQKASRTRGSWAGDLVATRKDGSTFVVQLSANLVSDEHGKPLCKMASFVDITERRRAEEEVEKHRDHLEELVEERAVELKRSEEKLRVAIASLNANVFTQDKELHFTWVFNPAPGFKPEAILGKTDGDVLPPTEASPVIEIKKRVLETGVGERSEFQFTVGGEARVFEVTVEPLRDVSGDVVGIIGVSRDVNEIKRAEKALQENEARYRELVESMSSAVAVYESVDDGNDFVFVEFNRAGEKIEGVRREDLIGKRVTEVFPGAKEFGITDVFRRVWKTGKSERFPAKIYQDNRIEGWRENYTYRLPTGEVVAIYDDVTEQKKSEEALRESEVRFRGVFESKMIGALFWNADGDITDANDTFLQMVGYSRDEILSGAARWRDMTPPEYTEQDNKALEEVASTGVMTPVEKEYIRKDGSRIPILLGAASLPGPTLSGVAFVVDITERKQAEGELRRYRDHLEELVESRTRELEVRNRIADIFLTRTDNEVFAEVMQLFMEETGSKHAVFSYYDMDRDAMVAPSMSRDVWEQCQVPDKDIVFPRDTWGDVTWARAFLKKRTIVVNEPSTRTPEGHIPINRHVALPVVHHGESIGLMEVANKSTDYDEKDVKILETIAGIVSPILHARLQRDRQDKKRKLAEEKVRQANLELGVANQELESFAYSVSHDLRSPLRSIGSFSQILIDEYRDSLDDQGKDYLRRVVAAAERMSELIRDMLELSRVTRAEMKKERVDLSSVAREIEEELRRGHPERNAEIVVAGDLVAEGDPRLLRLALQNLLDNAWKFTGKRAKPRIEFGCTEREGDQAFYVRDDGVGFDMRYAEKLFAPFQRLHSVVEFPGTGVGLATVQRIIHRHGGRVWAEGKVDEGATFYFSL